ncbi:type II 3-dehydroquinate dehydratase [Fangia hongkongensis]|uniref:type II 3-dehydroquinate dehydratase n=1 Tax=Fangia hongkongensis TaxID=270495 RepID=UPI000373C876|nr:type II 3-dehydroquinate dehydratase [Fangia hongkongensis]MBK2124147.1 type II 3-dehydroquinate dehydratase [Fangia hongkongensis]
MAKILVVHGPNLNLLGQRETDIYGTATLDSINQTLEKIALENKLQYEHFQSNHEGQIIDKLQSLQGAVDFIIINPAAYTHTSVGIRDTLLAVNIPFIETHLSNPQKREHFRHTSYFSDIAYGIISGFGAKSYELAMQAAVEYCQHNCV